MVTYCSLHMCMCSNNDLLIFAIPATNTYIVNVQFKHA